MWWWVLVGCGLPEGQVVDEAGPAPPGASLVREARSRRQAEIEEELARRRVARSEVAETVEDSILPLSQWGSAKLHKGADGKSDGFELGGIESGSPAALLGFKNGDVLHSVDGQSLADRTQAKTAWEAMQARSGPVEVQLTRRHKPTTVVVSIDLVKTAAALEHR